ncbi:fluoride efflux transporter FluC [Aeromicrobium sp. CF4.19]|uniref:fluoride efflux transporter FluC n=1 Tax=Aeromicrobium sp. CF4.19 TaxID=3373082 RepID=UPI003EE435D6
MTVILLAVAGGLGAAARLLVDEAVSARVGRRLPWGLLLVNATGSFGLGALVGAELAQAWHLVLGAGFLGGYTTFSAASVATAELSRRRDVAGALASSLGMLLVCVAAAALGLAIT